jgi:hypothetical protein
MLILRHDKTPFHTSLGNVLFDRATGTGGGTSTALVWFDSLHFFFFWHFVI